MGFVVSECRQNLRFDLLLAVDSGEEWITAKRRRQQLEQDMMSMPSIDQLMTLTNVRNAFSSFNGTLSEAVGWLGTRWWRVKTANACGNTHSAGSSNEQYIAFLGSQTSLGNA